MGSRADFKRRRRYAAKQKIKAATPPVPVPPVGRQKVFLSCLTDSGNVNWTIAHHFAAAIGANHIPDLPVAFTTHFQVGTKPVEYARNCVVDTFMSQPVEYDWLMMVDEDQVMPGNFWHLIGVMDADIVSGYTYTWVGNNDPAARLRVNQYGLLPKYDNVTGETSSLCFNLPVQREKQPQPYMVPVVGTGCIAIRRKVFAPKEEGGLGRTPFYFTRFPNGKTRGGEDINFSVDAQRAGFKIAVHPGVQFGHVKPLDIKQVDEFYQARHAFDNAGEKFTPERLLSIG